MCTRTREKRVLNPQETDPDISVSVQESPVEAWVSSGLLQVEVTECSRCAQDLLKGVSIFFITFTIVWSQVKQQGRNTVPSINKKKIGLKIY